jgi:hypothetical protein
VASDEGRGRQRQLMETGLLNLFQSPLLPVRLLSMISRAPSKSSGAATAALAAPAVSSSSPTTVDLSSWLADRHLLHYHSGDSLTSLDLPSILPEGQH